MICACPLSEGYCFTTCCGTPHKFHYDCLLKSLLNDQLWKKSYRNQCPYCRSEIGYLPLINGMKRIYPKIHYSPETEDIPDITEFQTKCQHIIGKGKRKGECCLKNSFLGYSYCKIHAPKYKDIDTSKSTYYINP